MKSLLISFALLILGNTASAQSYNVNPTQSHLRFSVKKLVALMVKGEFHEFQGVFHYDSEHLQASEMHAVVKTQSLETENIMPGDHNFRDKHLRGEDFFDVPNYPDMKFDSTGVKQVISPTQVILSGNLTIRNAMRPVEFAVELVNMQVNPVTHLKTAHFRATTVVNRKDFGMTWNQLVEGVTFVHDEVNILLEIEGVEAAP